MSDSVDTDMNPTPRRRRRSKDMDPPNLSEDRDSGNVQEKRQRREDEEELERLRREEEERLRRAPVLKEEMKSQEIGPWSPDQLKEIDKAVRELKNIADDVHNDKDAVVVVAPAFLLIRRGVLLAAFGALIAVVGAVLFLFTEGGVTVFGTGAVLFTVGTAIVGIAELALRAYNKKIEGIRVNASSRMTELSRSAATENEAVSEVKRLSGSPDTAADSDPGKVFETLETDSRLRDLIRRMEDTGGAEKLADGPIDQMAETIFPNNLEEFYSWFGIIVSFNIREQKNEKARKIDECAVKLEENLKVVREIHAAVTTRLN